MELAVVLLPCITNCQDNTINNITAVITTTQGYHIHSTGVHKMTPKSPNKLKHSDITSLVDGKDLGDMIELWKDTAESDARLFMLAELKKKKTGI